MVSISKMASAMLPAFLVSETTIHGNGESEPVEIPPAAGVVLLTLGITHVIEQESLTLTIHGSVDGKEWRPEPLITFPQKFYTGVWAVSLDLNNHPDIRFIRAQWKTNRWGRGDKQPSFRLYLFAELAAVTTG